MNRVGLPPAAVTLVGRIETLLAEAETLLSHTNVTDETSYALRETGRRYLPDTIASFLDFPLSQRDSAAEEMLIGQLTILERATAQRLTTLAEAARIKQSANGAFLAQKFGDAESLPAAPEHLAVSEAPPQTLVTRLFADLDGGRSADPASLLQFAGERLAAALPRLVTVTRGMFGGAVKAVAVDLPVGDHVLRYALRSERAGVEASCTKIVRGVALKTERVEVDEWLSAFLEDVTTYVSRDRAGRAALDKFLGK